MGKKLAYGLGDGGCNFVWTTIGSFLTLYYTDSVGISAAVVGTIMLITRLLDGVSDIGMGIIIDRTNTRWGKARPWILWSAVPMGLGLVMLFSVPQSLSSQGKIVYAFITYTIMAAVVYTACNLAYNTLLSLATSDPKERVAMSSIRFFCTMSCVLFLSYTTSGLVEKLGWTGMAAVFGTIAVVLLLVTFIFIKEENAGTVREKAVKEKKEPIAISFKALMKNKYFILVTIIFVVNYTALGLSNGIRIYYARDILGNAALFGTLTLCFILPKLIGNLFFAPISQKFGKWKCLMIGYVLEIGGLILIAVMPQTMPAVMAGLIINGIGGVPHNAGLFALVADIVDYGEWKTGKRIDGLTYSATSFGMKVGTGLGSAFVGWGLAIGGYNAALAEQSASTLTSIKALFTYVPIGLFAVGAVVMLFINIDKIYPQIAKDLAERRMK